ncbi:MAG: pyridoxamine 5'-phosphate oxidase family protein [Flavisolibacter sp.]
MASLTPEITEFIHQTKLGFIATVCPDGTANLSPKGTTIAWDDDHLVFADIHSPGTILNLLNNDSIEINVVDVFSRKGYRFKGRARVLKEGEIFDSVVSFYRSSGSPYVIHHIVCMHVDRVLPLSSPAYDYLSGEEITKKWIDYWESVHPNNK